MSHHFGYDIRFSVYPFLKEKCTLFSRIDAHRLISGSWKMCYLSEENIELPLTLIELMHDLHVSNHLNFNESILFDMSGEWNAKKEIINCCQHIAHELTLSEKRFYQTGACSVRTECWAFLLLYFWIHSSDYRNPWMKMDEVSGELSFHVVSNTSKFVWEKKNKHCITNDYILHPEHHCEHCVLVVRSCFSTR